MKWPWTRDQKQAEEDQAALDKALAELAEARARWPRVEEAVEAMRLHRRRNHFAENIEAIYTGRRQ